MKPPKFDYHAPASVAEAIELLGRYQGDAKVLAGGQSLLPVLNFRLTQPAALIDINRIDALSYIREESGVVRIGALTRQRMIEFSGLVKEKLPLLHEATRWIAHLPIRTRGTIGGSLAHADPSAEDPAVVTALEGEMVIAGKNGTRTAKPADFFQSLLTTSLAPDELLTEIRIPVMPPRAGFAMEEFARRKGDFAIVGIAAMVVRDGNRCAKARLACAGAGPAAIRLRAAEEILEQGGLDAASVKAAAKKAAELVRPESDLHASADYRRHLTEVLTTRALDRAIGRAQ